MAAKSKYKSSQLNNQFLFSHAAMHTSLQAHILLIPVIVWLATQSIKLIIDIICHHPIKISQFLVTSGGFPSGHSAVSSSILFLVRREQGFSLLFLVVAVFCILWWYDAMNVRYQAGNHAKILNTLVDHYLNHDSPQYETIKQYLVSSASKFPERLGHTPIEVIGGIIIGSILTWSLVMLPTFL
ncbi:MAG: divergent PAP2 family protein [Candidatus Absconditabacterales bacterium]|nr:divergent PAP2 family protein [Candidatus Absconditabacterales bacterium]